MECLLYSSQIFSVFVFSLFLYEMEEGRKEALTYSGSVFTTLLKSFLFVCFG